MFVLAEAVEGAAAIYAERGLEGGGDVGAAGDWDGLCGGLEDGEEEGVEAEGEGRKQAHCWRGEAGGNDVAETEV